ncbi:hypothetical protein PhaeoP71_01863 [Phaeobacter piscinae]|nr:hypothetical protein PhaeoP71_01863 [Phaeobacter piscinae]
MDRRTFLVAASAAVIAPALPSQSGLNIGLEFGSGPDQTVTRLLAIQKGVIREVHRVTGTTRPHPE